jgi:Flp pilus assembly protein TadD
MTRSWNKDIQSITICVILIALIAAVFGRVAMYDFVKIDDHRYTYRNPVINEGITLEGFVWSFQASYDVNWFPLTWISYMIDVEIFGTGPKGHHVMNVVYHTASTLLLFLVLRGMTGAIWPSAAVAALFALHPLRVESVAWISERKDVLSALFWMLTLHAYWCYVRKPGLARYLGVVFAFVLGLMSKAMVVTLPFVLLLLDYWPLRRVQTRVPATCGAEINITSVSVKRLVLEKLPLLACAIAVCIVTFHAQTRQGAVATLEAYPVWTRIGNAAMAYTGYLGKLFWPVNLTVFYPHPGHPPLWKFVAAIVVLAAISGAVLVAARRHPYGLVGWLWYLGTLVPVIGFIQVGNQSMADRYTYLPLIGIFIALVWTCSELASLRPYAGRLVATAGAAAIVALATIASAQAKHWRNSETLMLHAVAVSDQRWLAHNSLGCVYLKSNRLEKAQEHYLAALTLKPDYFAALNNMGITLYEQGKYDDAISYYDKALASEPERPDVLANVAAAYSRSSRNDEAIIHYRLLLELSPENDWAHHDIANVFTSKGDTARALIHFREATRISPDFAEAHNGLGECLNELGHYDEAIQAFREALRLKPDFIEARANYDRLLQAEFP